ncbi:MAG TPA: DNA repair and recombination protein RadB [Thermoplasmata archaeon]|nr:DNA repair and recombination protein RadB [Thermoplasmata archaeon]
MGSDRVPTGVAALDRILGGGLEVDAVTQFYGEGGSGKTVACVEAARGVALAGRWVAYVDTEGLSIERLRTTSGDRADEVLEKLLVATPKSMDEQRRAVRVACGLARDPKRPLGLIVLDSATFYYRLTLGDETEDAGRRALAEQLGFLVATALHEFLPVVVTNQVWRNVRDGTLEPLGGSFLNHAAKSIVRFDRLSGDRRRVALVKHRSLPPTASEFRITDRGTA